MAPLCKQARIAKAQTEGLIAADRGLPGRANGRRAGRVSAGGWGREPVHLLCGGLEGKDYDSDVTLKASAVKEACGRPPIKKAATLGDISQGTAAASACQLTIPEGLFV